LGGVDTNMNDESIYIAVAVTWPWNSSKTIHWRLYYIIINWLVTVDRHGTYNHEGELRNRRPLKAPLAFQKSYDPHIWFACAPVTCELVRICISSCWRRETRNLDLILIGQRRLLVFGKYHNDESMVLTSRFRSWPSRTLNSFSLPIVDTETRIPLTLSIKALARNNLRGTKIEIAWSPRVRLMFAEAPRCNVIWRWRMTPIRRHPS